MSGPIMANKTRGADFTGEALSYVDILDRELLGWASSRSDLSVRRALHAVHSLKGAAGFVGDDPIELRAHALEELIVRHADAERDPVDPAHLAQIRAGADELRRELTEEAPAADSGERAAGAHEGWLSAGDALIGLLRQGRRLAADYGKHVQVCLGGAHVLVDPCIVEAIRAPLGHVLRNAVAHAVEPPAVRARSGKPYFATILIEVEEHLAELVVRVQDDGPGLDLAALKSRAESQGLAREGTTRRMDAKDLAFLPGISTAARVDSLAGRGVGLQAARDAVEAAGGTLELSSELGRSTTVLFRMPRGGRAAPLTAARATRTDFVRRDGRGFGPDAD